MLIRKISVLFLFLSVFANCSIGQSVGVWMDVVSYNKSDTIRKTLLKHTESDSTFLLTYMWNIREADNTSFEAPMKYYLPKFPRKKEERVVLRAIATRKEAVSLLGKKFYTIEGKKIEVYKYLSDLPHISDDTTLIFYTEDLGIFLTWTFFSPGHSEIEQSSEEEFTRTVKLLTKAITLDEDFFER